MLPMMHSSVGAFSVLIYSMQEEILSQHLSLRKCGLFKVSIFLNTLYKNLFVDLLFAKVLFQNY